MIQFPLKRVFNVKEFRHWFEGAPIGEGIIYHVGDLAFDRLGGSLEARTISDVANSAWEHGQVAELHLLQKKLGDNHYEYRAYRTSPRNARAVEKWLRRPLSRGEIEPIHKFA